MKKELLALCRRRGLTEQDLDELVHEAATKAAMPEVNEKPSGAQQEGLLNDAEQKASRANNEGLEAQIDYLIQQCGVDETKKLIDTAEHQ